jgi:hypothetical protein
MRNFLAFNLLLILLGTVQADEVRIPDPNQVLQAAAAGPGLNCDPDQTCSSFYLRTGKDDAQICNEYRRNTNTFLNENPDGSVIINPNAIENAISSMRPAEAGSTKPSAPRTPETERLIRMFRTPATAPALTTSFQNSIELLKTVVREQITQGADPATLNYHQRYLLSRLDTLEVRIGFTANCNSTEEGHPFNARYQGTSNTMYVCPLLTHMAPEGYMALLAHELGHFVDPCNFARIYKYSAEIRALEPKAQGNRIREDINRCLANVPVAQRNQFSEWATAATRVDSGGLPFYQFEGNAPNINRTFAERLKTCGVVSEPQGPFPPETYEGSPYLPLLSCINSNHTSTRRPLTAASRINDSTCERRSVVAETVADYVSSSVIARMINRYPERFPAETRSALPQFYTSVACFDEGSEDYVSPAERLSIFLSADANQRALTCDGSAIRVNCPIPENLTGTIRGPASR